MSVVKDIRDAYLSMHDAMGTEVTLKNASVSYNSQGDEVTTYSSTTVKAIIEPYYDERRFVGATGAHEVGEYLIYLEYDVSVSVGDIIVFDSTDHYVEEVRVGYPSATGYKQCVIRRIG